MSRRNVMRGPHNFRGENEMSRTFFRAALGGLAAAAAMFAPALADSAPAPPAKHHLRTVFIILMENHNWTGDGTADIQGNPDAPYINKTLIPMSSYANEYYNPPHNHPSLP